MGNRVLLMGEALLKSIPVARTYFVINVPLGKGSFIPTTITLFLVGFAPHKDGSHYKA